MKLPAFFKKPIFPYFTVTLVVFLSTFVLWLPFILKATNWLGLKIEGSNFQYVYKHYDGPLYIIPAKTLYDIKKIDTPDKGFILSIPLTAKYFAAHLPLYPLFISLFSFIFGYLKSMIFTSLIFEVFLANFFYFILKKFKFSQYPLLLTLVFLFLPRFLVVRSIGSPESLFILLILISLFFFEKERFLLSGLFGGLATMTKIPGILLFPAYFIVLLERIIREKKFNFKSFWLLLIPLSLFLVFFLYQKQFNDFFAYFHTGGVVPMPYPFSVFNSQAKWVGTAWLEEIIIYFFIYTFCVISLKNIRYRSFFYFPLIFLMATIFVQHRDISRYALPIWPFACIAFEKQFTSKKFMIAVIILLPALYLFAWNFMIQNVMPISDWSPFL